MTFALGAYISDSAGFYPVTGDSPPSSNEGLDNWQHTFGAVPPIVLDYVNWTIPSVASTSQTDASYASHGFPQFDQRAFLVPRSRGTVLFIKWTPWDYLAGATYSAAWTPWKLSTIASGTYDPWITGWALAAAAYRTPIFLSFGHEMNGNYYPWGCASGNPNGNTAADFVAAWQRVVTIFRANGATNVKWVWSPNVASSFPMTGLYPGDAYVDWIGWDGYCSPQIGFTQFSNLFSTDYTTLAALGGGTKPIMIAEAGCRAATNGGVSSGDSATARADWLNQAFEMGAYSGTGFSQWPRVQAFIYYHQNQGSGGDWRLTSDANTQAAWKAITTDARYQGVFSPDLSQVVSKSSLHAARSYTARSYTGRSYTAAPPDSQHATITFPTP